MTKDIENFSQKSSRMMMIIIITTTYININSKILARLRKRKKLIRLSSKFLKKKKEKN